MTEVSGAGDPFEQIQMLILPLKEKEFRECLNKTSAFLQSAANAKDPATAMNFLCFARRNLDTALNKALESVVWRPKLRSKSDEQKKANALQKTFDRVDDPAQSMLEHYIESSDPLNKYLVAGTWGHEYLKKRKADIEKFDMEICNLIGCRETAPGKVILAYAKILLKMDEIERRICADRK